MVAADQYSPDRSLKGKVRRRLVRLVERRPAQVNLQRSMISFTFDDAPVSALTAGAKALESRGLRGTYFICAGLAGEDSSMGRYANREELMAASAAGHELACHTYSHIDCGAAGESAIAADIERNDAALAEWGAPRPTNFAYPYGDVSQSAKRVLNRRFGLSRALHHGLIETGTDLNQAPAVGIEGPAGGIYARRWLDYAASRKAWLILYTHDVLKDPSPCGCTPSVLNELVARAQALGCDVVTVAEGARRIGAAAPA